ncbi:hypothetical protein NPIL_214891 [Nephila pilipes]|uniref:Uncharacterized protein n=1 Tax=Nephila pilipes TaxID=299642 RepID=A0A8X6N8N7_NEPPI|nr:hypothetical protein NPIL_214891 [Nephila pilipes]
MTGTPGLAAPFSCLPETFLGLLASGKKDAVGYYTAPIVVVVTGAWDEGKDLFLYFLHSRDFSLAMFYVGLALVSLAEENTNYVYTSLLSRWNARK